VVGAGSVAGVVTAGSVGGQAAEGRQTRCFGCGATPHRARGDGDTFAARRSGWEVRYRRQGSSTGAESLCPDCFRKWGWW
jgi:hypothetical protein